MNLDCIFYSLYSKSVIVEQNAGEQVSGSTSVFVSLEEDSDMSENEPVLPGALPVFSSSSSSATTVRIPPQERPGQKASGTLISTPSLCRLSKPFRVIR